MTNRVIFIVYVSHQSLAKDFYRKLLQIEPILDVPGMTEFQLAENAFLGIMPGQDIVEILEHKINKPHRLQDTPSCEIYLYVDEPDEMYKRLLSLGGKELSAGKVRSWGDYVCYGCDLDGNILAFARPI